MFVGIPVAISLVSKEYFGPVNFFSHVTISFRDVQHILATVAVVVLSPKSLTAGFFCLFFFFKVWHESKEVEKNCSMFMLFGAEKKTSKTIRKQ